MLPLPKRIVSKFQDNNQDLKEDALFNFECGLATK